MAERLLSSAMDPARIAEVHGRLYGVERDGTVRIGFAIESGSRAWGFPSPDSDYDCRFVFMRRQADYLTLFAKRDVIETPLTATMDVNGWDLAKALKLMLNGNAVIIEWLMSPIVYREIDGLRAQLLTLAETVVDRPRVLRHYYYLALRLRHEVLADREAVRLKKLFYALRPMLALRWLRQRPHARIAPMSFVQLSAEADLPASLTALINDLLALKSQTREMGSGPLPQPLADLIDAEFVMMAQDIAAQPAAADARAEALAAADASFRMLLQTYAPNEHGGSLG
jgi:uncharacterized protein